MLNENLKAIRKEKGFTQESLAIALHVVRQTVSKWEKGLSVPDAEMLVRIAEVLDTDVSRLLGAAPQEGGDTRSETAVMLARINEQLAIRNRRGRIALRICIALLIFFIAVPLVLGILGAVNFADPDSAAGSIEWRCTLDGKEYVCAVQYNDRYRILASMETADTDMTARIDANKYNDARKLSAALYETFDTVEVTAADGLPLP
ncbi:MAG: helix-turn-helix transcriptional regulator [Clostridia bacterium]|nr:helix-turn-helix transcriptional regulator [Clostridia bacterium]